MLKKNKWKDTIAEDLNRLKKLKTICLLTSLKLAQVYLELLMCDTKHCQQRSAMSLMASLRTAFFKEGGQQSHIRRGVKIEFAVYLRNTK